MTIRISVNAWPITDEIFTSFGLKQESPFDSSLDTDQTQGSGLGLDQNDFSSLNTP